MTNTEFNSNYEVISDEELNQAVGGIIIVNDIDDPSTHGPIRR